MIVPALLLLRHGKSDWNGNEPDLGRPLSARGRGASAVMGRYITRLGELPDAVLQLTQGADRAEAGVLTVTQVGHVRPVQEADLPSAVAGSDGAEEIGHSQPLFICFAAARWQRGQCASDRVLCRKP